MTFQWEYIGLSTKRAQVVGGWIVNNYSYSQGSGEVSICESMVFIPDPDHTWVINK